jgi:ribosome recycling factor
LKEATNPVIDDTLLEAEEKMERAVEHAKEEFAAIRTGRATPAMFSKILIDYYGTPTPLPQMASIGIPEPRMVIVKPYDASQLAAMEQSDIDKIVKDGEAGEDDGRRGEKELDDVTHRYVASVDELLKHKEAELLEV